MRKDGRAGQTSDDTPPRPYHHGNLRGAILAAALDVLTRQEPSTLSLRDLARTVGVGHSAIYSHFRDRSALLAAIADEGFRALLADLQAAAARQGKRLPTLAAAYLAFARSRPAYYRAMFLPEVNAPENNGRTDEACKMCLQTLIEALAAASAASAASKDVVHEKAVAIWSALHGLALLTDDAGPLHSQIPPGRDADLASKIIDALANADWR